MISESQLEQQCLKWFREGGWDAVSGYDIAPDSAAPERANYREVVLEQRFRRALARLNPQAPDATIDEAVQHVLKLDHPVAELRNREFHRLLLYGIKVSWREGDEVKHDDLRLVDFANLDTNDFLVVKQFAIKGTRKTCRPDIVVFINGLPLAIIELKDVANEQVDIWDAWQQLQTYKEEIPDVFNYNEALIISDGITARIGSLTADKERFQPWRAIKNESDNPVVDFEIEKIIRGFFDRELFLDYLKHFILFEQDGDRTIKKIAAYHQFHAVREAVRVTIIAARESEPGRIAESRAPYGNEVVPGSGKAGVVWHTQGSGKSISMLCYVGKLIQQKEMKNPTVVVVTDRNDLDGQLYKTFCSAQELLRQEPEQADSREELRDKLMSRQAGGIIFTTIQKFAPLARTSELPSPWPSPRGRGDGGVRGESNRPSPSGRGVGGEGVTTYRSGLEVARLVKQARALRQAQTPAEDLLWALLRNRQLTGAKFRRQHQFGSYICDFYCDEAKLVVECDGEVHASPETIAHDEKRDAFLKSSGLKVLRFENQQILNSTEEVLNKITSAISPGPSPKGRGDESGLDEGGLGEDGLPSPSGRGGGGEGDVA
jgi:Type I site-specific restriction-modification system, R (restriction) subunit and related helicases